MPDVSFSVGSRRYTLRCASGQEDHLRTVAAALDARVQPIAAAAPGVDDRQVLVMAAIALLDELQAAKRAPQDAEPRAADAQATESVDALRAENAALRAWADAMASRLTELAERLPAPADGTGGNS